MGHFTRKVVFELLQVSSPLFIQTGMTIDGERYSAKTEL